MFRLRTLGHCLRLRRPLHLGTVNRDQVLDQLSVCSGEDQLFEVVGRNRAKLNVSHVGHAVGMLWHFQRSKPQMLRTAEPIRSHPQFLTLRVLAENKISLMDDAMLVNLLYNVLRLSVEHHDSLVQHMVSEAWLRLDGFSMSSLSKFAVCLSDMNLQHSPLMGQIADNVNHKLSSVDDARILSTLMVSISPLVSVRLRDALICKAEDLLSSMDRDHYNNPRRVVQFLRNIKYSYRPLLETCNQILLHNVPHMTVEDLSIILGFYQSLQFNSCDFRLAAKQRLMELVDSSTDPISFTKLFVALGPMADQETKEWMESMALLLAEEFNPQQALAVADMLEEIHCRNHLLIHKIASILNKNMHVYKSVELAKMTQALISLRYQGTELFSKLRSRLANFLQNTVFPYEVVMLIRVLSMLPFTRLDEAIISRVKAVLPQCSLNDLGTTATTVAKWVRGDPSYRHGTPVRYVRLLQTLNLCGQDRLRTADSLDLLLEELKYISGEWFEEILLDEVMVTLQRMENQITWANASEMAVFITRTNHLCIPLMERLADVVAKDIDEIYHTATYAALLPFAVLNYDSPRVDEMFEACIQRFTPHIGSFDPHLVVLLAYALAMADCFPEELIEAIFNVEFLAKLDAQLETLPVALNVRVRQRLMELNRAVCLECPEFQVPWFHERYCQHHEMKGNITFSSVQQQIHKMLGEVLGGISYARVAVRTPYFYTVDFECVLDKRRRPVPYTDPDQLKICDHRKVRWVSDSPMLRSELPAGAQRIAVDFLGFKSFCKNSRHMKGPAVMRKRHLEILGYHVVQIPHFEWNSMELSTHNAWKEYLRKKIFTELP